MFLSLISNEHEGPLWHYHTTLSLPSFLITVPLSVPSSVLEWDSHFISAPTFSKVQRIILSLSFYAEKHLFLHRYLDNFIACFFFFVCFYPAWCISYFCCFDKIPNKINLRRVYIGSQSDGTVLHCRGWVAAGAWRSCSHCTHSQGTERKEYWCLAHFHSFN